MSLVLIDEMWRLCIALVLVAACGTASPPVALVAPASPSPTSSPITSSALAVFYDVAAGRLSMVDAGGQLVASTTVAAPPRRSGDMPWTSATRDRLYFLDAASDVSFLAPDGSKGLVAHVALAPGEEAGIAVSPDDQKIAVAVLRYGSAGYLGMRIYVESLVDGSGQAEIYTSPTVAEYPIAWTAGHLVIALGLPFCCDGGDLNPFGASEYHIADPATGERLVTLCRGGRGPIGPPATIGVTCGMAQLPNRYLRWDGSPLPEPGAAPDGALSPDGTQVASGTRVGIQFFCAPSCPTTLIMGDVAGWLDGDHIVYRDRATSELYIGPLFLTGQSIHVPVSGRSTAYLGTVPTAIG